MARNSTVPKTRARSAPVVDRGTADALRSESGDATNPIELNQVIHGRVRLGILSALAVTENIAFNDLKKLLNTSDGNLSVHARRLEDAGYITCTKSFDHRIPRTEFRLTRSGRESLERYLDHMEALIQRVRETT